MVESVRNSSNAEGNGQRYESESAAVPALLVLNDQGGGILSVDEIPATLRAQEHGHQPVVCFEPGIAKRDGGGNRFMNDISGTLRANMGDNQPAVCYAVKTKQIDMRTSNGTAHPLDGNDGKEPQTVCYSPPPPAAFMGGQGAKARSIAYCDDGTTPTLKSAPSGSNTVPDVVYTIDHVITTGGNCTAQGPCYYKELCPTQKASGAHAVCYRKEN